VTQREINRIARHVAKVNDLLWRTIGETELLVNDPVVRELIDNDYEHVEILNKLSQALDKVNKYDGLKIMILNILFLYLGVMEAVIRGISIHCQVA
jgi:hypothetical protein